MLVYIDRVNLKSRSVVNIVYKVRLNLGFKLVHIERINLELLCLVLVLWCSSLFPFLFGNHLAE